MRTNKTPRILLGAVVSLLVAFWLYANWQEKSFLSTSMVVIVPIQPLDSLRFEEAQSWLVEQPSVKAVSGEVSQQQLVVSLDSGEEKGQELLATLAAQGYPFKPIEVKSLDSATAVAPFPAKYVRAFQQLIHSFPSL